MVQGITNPFFSHFGYVRIELTQCTADNIIRVTTMACKEAQNGKIR